MFASLLSRYYAWRRLRTLRQLRSIYRSLTPSQQTHFKTRMSLLIEHHTEPEDDAQQQVFVLRRD